MSNQTEDEATRLIRRLAEGEDKIKSLITVDNPERSIRTAVLERIKALGITEPNMQADLAGNGIMDIEIYSRRYLEGDDMSDEAFQNLMEEAYHKAQETKRKILKKQPVRGEEPDERFPKGMIEYYHETCRDNKFNDTPFVSEDRRLTLTAKEVQDAITSDLRMVACRTVLQEIGFDSPILQKSVGAEKC